MDIAPSTASHHLKELRQAGLIKTRRRGRMVECWVDPQVLKDLASFLDRDSG
jgi:ArsR family transcriptional regulator